MAEVVQGDDVSGLDFSLMEKCYDVKRIDGDAALGNWNKILYATMKLRRGQVIGKMDGNIFRMGTLVADYVLKQHKGWIVSLNPGMDTDAYIMTTYYRRNLNGVHIANDAENRIGVVNNAYLENVLKTHLVADEDECHVDVYMVAKQDIEIGDEICISYGSTFFKK